MRARRADAQAGPAREADDLAAQPRDLAPRFEDVAADRRADLDHRLVHLALDLVVQPLFTLGEELLNVGPQLARLRVDDLKLFLDAEGEGRLRHEGRMSRTTSLRSADPPPLSYPSA